MARCLVVFAVAVSVNLLAGQGLGGEKAVGHDEALDILNQSLQKYARAKTYQHTENVTISVNTADQPRTQSVKVTLAFQRPNKIAAHWPAMHIVCDGAAYRALQAMMMQYVETPAPPKITEAMVKDALRTDQPLPLILSALIGDDPRRSLLENVKRLSYLGAETLDGRDMHVLTIERRAELAKVWIDRRSLLIRKVELTDPQPRPGAPQYRVTIRYDHVKVDQPIAADAFAFVVPPGYVKVSRFSDTLMHNYRKIGQRVPDLTADDLKGASRSLTRLPAKVKVLSFWATWCVPCLHELPVLQRLFDGLKDEGLLVVGVNVDDPKNYKNVRAAVNKMKLTFPVLLDKQGAIANWFEARNIPTLIIIGPDNRIVEAHQGYSPRSEKEIHRVIEQLLAPSATSAPTSR